MGGAPACENRIGALFLSITVGPYMDSNGGSFTCATRALMGTLVWTWFLRSMCYRLVASASHFTPGCWDGSPFTSDLVWVSAGSLLLTCASSLYRPRFVFLSACYPSEVLRCRICLSSENWQWKRNWRGWTYRVEDIGELEETCQWPVHHNSVFAVETAFALRHPLNELVLGPYSWLVLSSLYRPRSVFLSSCYPSEVFGCKLCLSWNLTIEERLRGWTYQV